MNAIPDPDVVQPALLDSDPVRVVDTAPQTPPLRGWARLVAWLNMLFVDHSIFRFFFNLRQQIAPGFYRSSHPMPYQLRAAAHAGIKTVLNLRGADAHIGSNQLEWDTARDCGLKVLHFPMGSRDVPPKDEIFGLVQIVRDVQYPLLIHCKSGADRAGFVSTIYQLVCMGQPLPVARRELRFWWHGHVRQAKTGILDHFFDCYAAAHARNGIGFLDWVRNEYDRDAVRQSFREQWWAAVVVDKLLRRE